MTQSFGLDLCSAHNDPITITPNLGIVTINTDIAIEPPQGAYVKIVPHSSLARIINMHVAAGVINSNYRGNITVRLINQVNITLTIHGGALIILKKESFPSILIVNTLTPTLRNNQDFGSI